MPSSHPSRYHSLLLFEVAGFKMAVLSDDVREIIRMVSPIMMPFGDAALSPAIDLRGSIVPIFDGHRWFGLAPKVPKPSDHIIVAYVKGRCMALHVDRALELAQLEIAGGALESANDITSVIGFARNAEGSVPILNLERLMSSRAHLTSDKALMQGAGS